MPEKKTWIVTTSGDRPIGDVAKDLKAAGFKVGKVHSDAGSIIAQAPSEAAKKARGIKGVVDVSADDAVDIGPPGSDETW